MRIAVTGWGLVSALGRGVARNVEGLFAGRVPPATASRVSSTLRDPPRVFSVVDDVGEQVRALRSAGRLTGPARRWLRTTELAALVSAEALAGVPDVLRGRMGVAMGTTVGCAFDAEAYYRACLAGEHPGPDAAAAYLDNELATEIAAAVGAEGPTTTVVDACASSADAIGLAVQWLRQGECDCVLAGGADALHRIPLLGFGILRNTSSADCRPFDKNRAGLNLGEGAGALVLEREADAHARGARILGYVAGFATSADAHHPTAPHPEGLGLRRAISLALADADLAPSAIGLVHAHGTGTVHNDRVEGRALADLLGPTTPVFSSKGLTGHTMGAAGVLGVTFALACLTRGRAPRSVGFETPDPECVVVPATDARPIEAQAALCSSLAFGGTNSVVIVCKAEPSPGGAA